MTWRRVRGWATAGLRRHPRAALAGLAVVVAALVTAIVLPSSPAALPAVRAAGRPASGVPAEAPAEETRDSLLAHVYVDPASTPDERNLITAAIRRSWAGDTQGMVWDPDAAEFRDTYCNGGPVRAEAVAGLPYFFPSSWAWRATSPRWCRRSKACQASSPSSTSRPEPAVSRASAAAPTGKRR